MNTKIKDLDRKYYESLVLNVLDQFKHSSLCFFTLPSLKNILLLKALLLKLL